MSRNWGGRWDFERIRQSLAERLGRQWEEVFFSFLFILLSLQVFDFTNYAKSIDSSANEMFVAFAVMDNFIVNYFPYVTIPLVVAPLIALILDGKKSRAVRRYLDAVGIYIVVRMFIQLVGLNLLLFDAVTPGLTLVTQLLLFLPYSLLVWGWIYWRLDEFAATNERRYFLLDCERDTLRPIDYLVASFSTVFSASISAIKGRSARAKVLIIMHGFFVYDLMVLMLSRAVALVQAR